MMVRLDSFMVRPDLPFLCITVPFLSSCIVKNHGIPEEHVHGVVEIGKEYFALPLSEKLEVSETSTWPGWFLVVYISLISRNLRISRDTPLCCKRTLIRKALEIFTKGLTSAGNPNFHHRLHLLNDVSLPITT